MDQITNEMARRLEIADAAFEWALARSAYLALANGDVRKGNEAKLALDRLANEENNLFSLAKPRD